MRLRADRPLHHVVGFPVVGSFDHAARPSVGAFAPLPCPAHVPSLHVSWATPSLGPSSLTCTLCATFTMRLFAFCPRGLLSCYHSVRVSRLPRLSFLARAVGPGPRAYQRRICYLCIWSMCNGFFMADHVRVTLPKKAWPSRLPIPSDRSSRFHVFLAMSVFLIPFVPFVIQTRLFVLLATAVLLVPCGALPIQPRRFSPQSPSLDFDHRFSLLF